ncbi:MAG TPA: inorganic diphosphatase [Polyangia bacterium]
MRNPLSLPASTASGVLHVVVEAPAGSTTKIKWDPQLEAFSLSRPLPLGMAYPHDWGFVPSTQAADGDPVDAMVLSEGTTYPGLVIPCRPIGVVRLEQNRKQGGGRERNDRIIAVAARARRHPLRSADELAERYREEIARFFVNVVFFEDKAPELLGWGDANEAWQLVRASTVAGGEEPPRGSEG